MKFSTCGMAEMRFEDDLFIYLLFPQKKLSIQTLYPGWLQNSGEISRFHR